MPVLVLAVLVAFSATEYVADRRHLSHVAEQAARFATGAQPSPSVPQPPQAPPTPAAVAGYVEELSDLPVVAGNVTPDPTLLFPGAEVTVEVTVQHDLGPVADVADALAGLFGQDQNLSEEGMHLNSRVTKSKE